MPQIGSTNEPLHENANFVWTGSLWVPQSADANGYVNVNLKGIDDHKSNSYGLYDTSWKPDPVRFGFSGMVVNQVNDTNLSAGTNNLFSTVVPSGFIHVITQISMILLGTVPTHFQASLYKGTTTYAIYRQLAPVNNTRYDRQGFWVLEEDDKMKFTIAGATAGDDFYSDIMGYSVDLR